MKEIVALAPDLYQGQVTAEIDQADRLAGAVFSEPEGARGRVAEAAALLAEADVG